MQDLYKFENYVHPEFYKKLLDLKELGENPYDIKSFEKTDIIQIRQEAEVELGKSYKTAGRVKAIRRHGKAMFFDIEDSTGKIQIYLKADVVGKDKYKFIADHMKVGDIVGVEGETFITRTGELSIQTKYIMFLSKVLRPLPEKWHGLKDAEIRYRQRYLDLLVNKEVFNNFKKRFEMQWETRSFMAEWGFIEVETPILQPIAGGAAAKPFVTYHNFLELELFLRIAPELYLKRLLVGGFEKVFEMGRVFRNENISNRHNPEFTMLEAYAAYKDYTYMMQLTETLIATLAEKIRGSFKIPFVKEENGKRIEYEVDLTPPFQVKTYLEVASEAAGEEITEETPNDKLIDIAKQMEIELTGNESWGELVELIYSEGEKGITQPTFIIDYPIDISPLAKRKTEKLTERFELIINGWELANAFSELNDPEDQFNRFMQQLERAGVDKDRDFHRFDADYVLALCYAMPPAAGLGIGIDRLAALINGLSSIKEVILFPTIKPQINLKLEEDKEVDAGA